METALRGVIMTGIFVIPFVALLVVQTYFFPFITGKNFAFRFLAEIIFFSWLLLVLFHKEYRPKKTWILVSYVSFVGVLILSTIFSLDPFKSFWSNFERMEGLVTHLHLFGYFLVLISVLKSEKTWTRLFNTSIGVSVLVSLYALGQLFGWVRLFQSSNRLESTLGNSAYLAAYLLFHIFLITYLLARGTVKNIYLKIVYGVILIFEVGILLLTETRGAMIGLLAGVGIIAFLNVVWGTPKAKKYAAIFLSVLVVLGGVFFISRDSSFVQDQRVLRRLSQISLADQGVQARFTIWNMGLKGAVERPVLGWGLENFSIVFNKYYEASLYDQEPWFDRAHNVFLDWLTSAGILGLLAYLALFASSVYYLLFNKIQRVSFFARSVLVGLLGAYFVQNIFVFDNITSYILFFTFLAYVHHLYQDSVWEKMKEKLDSLKEIFKKGNTQALKWIAVPLIILLFVGTFYTTVIEPGGVARDLIVVLSSEGQSQDLEENLEHFVEIFERDTFGNREGREQFLRLSVAVSQIPEIEESLRVSYLDTASNQAVLHIQKHQFDTRMRLFLGSFFNIFSRHDLALVYLEEAQALSPNKQQIYAERAVAHLGMGDQQTALKVLAEAYELEKENRDIVLPYAQLLLRTGDASRAQEILIERFGEEEAARLLSPSENP